MRPVKLAWSPRARDDVDAIYQWIAEQNKSAATRVVAEIRKTATLIAQYPGIGRTTNRQSVRVLAIVRFPYLLYFTTRDREILILHVRHGSRAAPSQDEI